MIGARSAVLVVIALGVPGCALWGVYGGPTEEDIRSAAAAMKLISRQAAMREMRREFAGIGHAGRRIFDECRIREFGEWNFEVDCTSYRSDPNSREFRLIVEGAFSITVPYCDPTFKAVRQVPTMAHYFFVNGFSFGGDANRALRAYGLLSRICAEESQPK